MFGDKNFQHNVLLNETAGLIYWFSGLIYRFSGFLMDKYRDV
jgi:hypothetical protein